MFTIDAALKKAIELTSKQDDKCLEESAYAKILNNLKQEDRVTFTMGLANKGIAVKAQANYKTIIGNLKKFFTSLAKKQGCVYESDYHRACYSIEDSRVIGAINDWLVGGSVPLKKNRPKGDVSQSYKEDVESAVKHPNINKLKARRTAADTWKTDPSKDMPKVEKDVPKNTLNSVINALRMYEDEFLPAWNYDEKKLEKIGKKDAQMSYGTVGIDEEKRKVDDAIRYWDPPLSNAEDWLLAVQQATSFEELQNIWNSLWEQKGEATRPTEEYIEEITFDDVGDDIPLELDTTTKYSAADLLKEADEAKLPVPGKPTKEEVDPVDEHIKAEAKKLFAANTDTKKILIGEKEFTAYIASSDEQKVAGLEVFSSLENNESMLFPFEGPQHASFHMGAVQFPIDIIFLMESTFGLQAKKIVHNIQPGDSAKWSCNDVIAVLEVPGGTCKEAGVNLGSVIGVVK